MKMAVHMHASSFLQNEALFAVKLQINLDWPYSVNFHPL